MSKTTPAPPGAREHRGRRALLVLTALRAVLSVIAIPLVPVLYRDHFVVLVLLRPTKEVLLAGGFFIRRGEVHLASTLTAAIPLALFGVWLLYAVGRAYTDEIQAENGLPRWARRFLPKDRIQALSRILEKKGKGVIVAGRLAAFPSSLLGAAAGASDMKPGPFLRADALGFALSMAEVIGAGYVLGAAYKSAGPWLTGLGVAVLFGLLIVLGRWLRREGKQAGESKRVA
jgi:membrane protein DedA with SNARE-associated domain